MKIKLLFSIFSVFTILDVSGQTIASHHSKASKSVVARIKFLQASSSSFNHKRGAFTADIDNAIRYGQLALDLSEKYHDINLENESLCLIGEACFKSKKKIDGTNYFMRAIKNCQSLNDKAAEGEILLRMSKDLETYKLGGPEILASLQNAINIFLKINDQSDLIDAYQVKGSEFINHGNLDSAKIYLYESLSIAEKIKRKDRYNTYTWLSHYYRVTGDHDQALEFIQRALQNAKDLHSPATSTKYGDCYIEMGSLMIVGNLQDAQKYFEMAIDVYKKSNDEVAVYGLYFAYYQKSMALINEGKAQDALTFMTGVTKIIPPITDLENGSLALTMGEIYSALNKLDLAEKEYMEAIVYNKDYPRHQQADKAALMRFYSDSKQFDKLKAAAKTTDGKELVNTLIFMSKPDIEYQYYKLDSVNGDFKSALNHLRKWKILSDSGGSAAKTKQLNELQVKYETKEKEQSISILSNQVQQANLQRNIQQVKLQKIDLQRKIDQGTMQKMRLQRNVQAAELKNSIFQRDIQRADLQKSNLERNVTYFGLGMLLIILGVSYNGYRNKNRSNKMLVAQQSEINQQNIRLEHLVTDKDRLLQEKDWLLKEVHHRVKNNLQIVMSLLHSQAAYLDNKDAISAIGESQNRVHAISLIHQSLYKENERSAVDMAPYISDLVNNLKDSFDTNIRKIRFIKDVEPFTIDIAQAVPLGLILNEAITNAIKYAFDKKGGTITVSMKKSKADMMLMEVSDDGKGIDPQFELMNAGSLGMEMMKGLSKQVGGCLQIRNDNGTVLTVEYPLKNLVPFYVTVADNNPS